MFFSAFTVSFAAENQELKLWYSQPAEKWTDALPIGNGRMGAMVFGRIADERIQFNEDTLWKGHPHDYVRAGAGEQLSEIRRLLAEGNTRDATLLARGKFLSDPVRQKAYQPFGDLRIHFIGHDHATDYRRELDLDSAIARTTYRVDEVSYRREAFASYPDRAIVYRVSADHRGQVSFTLKLDSPHTNSATSVVAADVRRRTDAETANGVRLLTSAATLALAGQVEEGGLRFEARVRVVNTGGQIRTDGNAITVENADAVTLLSDRGHQLH